jgi:hypothetical protein
MFSRHPFFIRLFNWEYWSYNAIYGPVYIVFVWLCIRCRVKYFFSASNPSIANGGLLMEQKHEIYPLIPTAYYPAFFLVQQGTDEQKIGQLLIQHQFSFPLIAKPNIGMQGKAVKKVTNLEELLHYSQVCTVDFLVQQFSPYKNEVGIFYYRLPDEGNGNITGIVAKEPMKVTGDGISSLYQLISKEPRYLLQMNQLTQIYGEGLLKVLLKDEEMVLVPYGNHARGSKFLDWTFKTDTVFINSMDEICKQIDGFYYGRLDVMYDSWDDLRNGKNFHIIELNGAGADPTHMYDPRHSIFFAWKEIIRHWNILYKVSKANHRRGAAYMSLKEGAAMFKANAELVRKLNAISEKI